MDKVHKFTDSECKNTPSSEQFRFYLYNIVYMGMYSRVLFGVAIAIFFRLGVSCTQGVVPYFSKDMFFFNCDSNL
jgi:hypothetical protein